MADSPFVALAKLGQSIWLDFLSRDLLESGDLARFIKEDHLQGLTSNPSIFEKAIAKTNDYDHAILELSQQKDFTAKDVYEHLAVKDLKAACDLLRPVYHKTKGHDGYASLEVSPHLAHDARGSIEEGKRLWHMVSCPNLMIKIPGTTEGMHAIRALTAEGINVNVTLLFGRASYEQAALAYLHGLKDRAEKNLALSSVHSVASFFVSRIDSKIDPKLLAFSETSTDESLQSRAKKLIGCIAIANAKLAYVRFQEIYKTDLARDLAQRGAPPQRLLWASTSTKNPQFRDVLYVEALIGPETVNTVPQETLVAFRDHGVVSASLQSSLDDALQAMETLPLLGIDFTSVCAELEVEGIKLFKTAFDQLLKAVEDKLSRQKR